MSTSIETSDFSTPLRGVMPVVSDSFLEWRRSTGAGQWDEMWEGVLHMAPSPNRSHQDFEGWLEFWLRMHWVPRFGGRVYHQINVTPSADNWRKNYRVPDLVLLTPDRFHIDHNEFFCGPPAAVVEIHSLGDESYDKLPFYFSLGEPEVWIAARDTWRMEVFTRGEQEFVTQPAAADGWLRSPALGVEFLSQPANRLAVRLTGEDATREEFSTAR
ncbi:MAG: Uma2 family endonuclease [Pirellulales bacterium]